MLREKPPLGGGLSEMSSVGYLNNSENSPPLLNRQNKFQDPAAVAAARRELRLEFLHECAGGIHIHAALVQTFAEIGDTAGVCYALRRLFAHVKAAHPIYLELRDEAASNHEGRAP